MGRLADIRTLNRHLVAAEDEKILKILAMVDAMPQRGEADSLIEPLRARLAQLKLRRPMNAPRLLFIPLDPVLAPAPAWRRGALSVPRTVVPCLARQVTRLEPRLMHEVSDAIGGAMTDEQHVVRRVGARLWPRAAEVLATAPVPEDWAAATGLNEADHATIRAAVVLVLRHAAVIAGQVDADPPDTAVLAAILTEAADQPDALGVLIRVILHWVPAAAGLVLSYTSAHFAPTGLPGRTATERAVEYVLDGIEAAQEAARPGVAGLDRLRRTVAMLDELEAASIDRPTRSARIAATRARVDDACRGQFQVLLRDTVATRLESGLPRTPEAVAVLEGAARDVRRFEHTARRITGSDHYDKQLRGLVGALVPDGTDDAEARVDRLRLAEILLGPEKALQMLMDAEK